VRHIGIIVGVVGQGRLRRLPLHPHRSSFILIVILNDFGLMFLPVLVIVNDGRNNGIFLILSLPSFPSSHEFNASKSNDEDQCGDGGTNDDVKQHSQTLNLVLRCQFRKVCTVPSEVHMVVELILTTRLTPCMIII